MNYETIINFWFEELKPKQHWVKDPKLDQEIRERFLEYLDAAKRVEFFSWRKEPLGRLAEIIVLDQFSRNIYRDQPESFEADPLACALSQEAYHLGIQKKFNDVQKAFLLMPLMHSESQLVHELAVEAFSDPDLKGTLEFEMKHKVIIDRFGRYPHRNEILGRESTTEEVEFLKGPGSSF